MSDNASGPAVSSTRLLDGVCCQYCKHFEQTECPVKTASPWSRWGNWCNVYEPNPDEPEAKPFPFTSNAPRQDASGTRASLDADVGKTIGDKT